MAELFVVCYLAYTVNLFYSSALSSKKSHDINKLKPCVKFVDLPL